LLGINRPKSTILAHYCVKKPCNPSRIPSAFFRVLHSKSRILWCIRSFGLGIFRLREVKKRSHTGVCLRFFAHYQRKITTQNRLLPNKHRRSLQALGALLRIEFYDLFCSFYTDIIIIAKVFIRAVSHHKAYTVAVLCCKGKCAAKFLPLKVFFICSGCLSH